MLKSSIKLPYDNFTPDEIAGIFTIDHLIYIVILLIAIFISLFLSRKMSQKTEKKVRLIIAITVTVLEIIKIALRIYKDMGIETWLPLYFCSLFIFASWISLIPNERIARCGKSFMATGGIIAAIVFCIFPTTSLAFFPALHPASIHSYVYHFLMFYSGVILLWKGNYKPHILDGIGYFLLVCVVGVPSLIFNVTLETNCMFLSNPQGIPILQDIADFNPVLYTILALITQGILLFYIIYGIYKLITKKTIKEN